MTSWACSTQRWEGTDGEHRNTHSGIGKYCVGIGKWRYCVGIGKWRYCVGAGKWRYCVGAGKWRYCVGAGTVASDIGLGGFGLDIETGLLLIQPYFPGGIGDDLPAALLLRLSSEERNFVKMNSVAVEKGSVAVEENSVAVEESSGNGSSRQ